LAKQLFIFWFILLILPRAAGKAPRTPVGGQAKRGPQIWLCSFVMVFRHT